MMANAERVGTVKKTKDTSPITMKPPTLETLNNEIDDYEVIIKITFKHWFIVISYIFKNMQISCQSCYFCNINCIINLHRK